MERNITIDGKDVKFSNNIGWTMVYRDQFGRDIIPTLIPAVAGVMDIVSGILSEADEAGKISLADLGKIDGNTITDMMIHIGGLEFVDFLNITWSMAKAADPDIPEPSVWVRQFQEFPIDEIAPAIVGLIVDGIISKKNRLKLKKILGDLGIKKQELTT